MSGLTTLKILAEQLAGEPWRLHDVEPNVVVDPKHRGEIANTLNGFGDQAAYARYIAAANPVEVLGLIKQAEITQREAPHVLMRPAVYPDGDQWCALYGENLQEGVAGFGDTPELAVRAFDEAWRGQRLTPHETI